MRIHKKKTDFQGDHRLCMANTIAVGLVRGSTIEQVNTLAQQEQALRSYAIQKGLTLVGIIIDSGTSAEKVAFFDREKAVEAMTLLHSMGGYHLLTTVVDRAFRDYIDCGWTCKVLWEQYGISVHFTSEGLVSSLEKDKMVIQIRSSVAEEENRRRRDRQNNNFAIMRQDNQRCGHHEPFGWEVDPFRKRTTRRGSESDYLRPNDGEQKTLAWIFDRVREGYGTTTIAKALNAEGIHPKGKLSYLRGGATRSSKGIWHGSTVQSVLEHSSLEDGTFCLVTNIGNRLKFEFQVRTPIQQAVAA